MSLFSGYGGIDLALEDYARTIIYCEIEQYAQGILLSRMDDGLIPFAPIWNDVTTLDGTKFRGLVDIIAGGFPCQDISVAGNGVGLAGKRSGLFYEIVRLTKEIQPSFVFLENVPAIRTRGLEQVIKEFTEMGYDCRWTMLSASSVGANHKRERWFFLAYSNHNRHRFEDKQKCELWGEGKTDLRGNGKTQLMANSEGFGVERLWPDKLKESCSHDKKKLPMCQSQNIRADWWSIEPDVARVVNGVKFRMDRIKALGNGVVPIQAKKAFEKLIGINEEL